MPYAFYFDSRFCSGCKACQIACQDKHGLAIGQSWRRVYEVSGGEWQQQGAAWISHLYAYHLSIACNHCARPICAEVCPSRAMTVRPDGIVLVQTERCLGCNYCRWACPYEAPQLDPQHGWMTKCTFCEDELAQGRPPACVAACGLRTLDFGELSDLQRRYPGSAEVYPLPAASLTEPGLLIRPHATAEQAARQAKHPLGQESHEKGTGSLVAFTLLAQSGVGLFLGGTLLGWVLAARPERLPTGQVVMPIFVAGLILLACGMLASLLHLGVPRNAWRALGNLRSSWLSREILCAGLFGFSGLLATTAWEFRLGSLSLRLWLSGAASLTGLALVYAMSRVYRLRTLPAWDRPATTLSFYRATLLLGALLTGLFALQHATANARPGLWLVLPAFILALAFELRQRLKFYQLR